MNKQNIHNFKYLYNALKSYVTQLKNHYKTKVLSQFPLAEFVVIFLTLLAIFLLQSK